ncbi:MAG: endonuclease/exonuclease/phosphatase family protein [bacterium]|nr:endonuclease/exonuclease/phosphatase family protein [bacterium]
MIKLIFKIIIACILLFFLGIVILYFYGSSTKYDSTEYQKVNNYKIDSNHNPDTVTIMTYNMGYASGMTNNRAVVTDEDLFANNMQSAINLINKLDIDILALQEVDFNSDRSYNVDQAESLSLACDFSTSAQATNWDKAYVPFPYWPPSTQFGQIHSGQAILSKFPIDFHERVVLKRPENQPFYYSAFYIDRLLEVVKLKIDSTDVIIMNVHLEAYDQKTRQGQAKKVLEHYNFFADSYPVLLVGDFNAIPNGDTDTTIETILSGQDIMMATSMTDYGEDPKSYYTYSSANPEAKIDYIFYNRSKIMPVETRVVREALDISDHLPVLAKFVIIKDDN